MSGDAGSPPEEGSRSFYRGILDGVSIGGISAAKHIRQELERLWMLEDQMEDNDGE